MCRVEIVVRIPDFSIPSSVQIPNLSPSQEQDKTQTSFEAKGTELDSQKEDKSEGSEWD